MKKFLAIALAALMLFSLAACGGNTDEPKEAVKIVDINLTEELINEGFVREVISKIQTMRKEAGFNVTDHIKITVEGSEKIIGIVLAMANDIVGDTLADSLDAVTPVGYIKEWNINGETLNIGVEKI